MKKIFIISLFMIFTLACGATENIPSSQSSPITETQTSYPFTTLTPSLNPTPTEPQGWVFSTSTTRFDFGEIAGIYNKPGISFLTNEYDAKSQRRIFYYADYYTDNSNVFFMDPNNYITAVGITSERILWKSDRQGYIIGLGLNTVLMKTNDNRIYGLDKNTGIEKWKIIIGTLLLDTEKSEPFPFIQYYNDEIIAPLLSDCGDYRIIRFLHINENTEKNWLTKCNNDSVAGNLIAFVDGIFITVGSSSTNFGMLQSEFITAYNPNDGSVVWNKKTSGEMFTNLGIKQYDIASNILYIQSNFVSNGYGTSAGISELYAVNPATGKNLWGKGIFELNGLTEFQEWEGISDFLLTEKYIFYFNNSIILVFEKDNGSLLNKIEPPRSFIPYFSESGLIIYYPDLGIANGIDIKTSDTLWENDEFKITEPSMNIHSYIHFDNIIILNSSYKTFDSHVNTFATDVTNGDELWRWNEYNSIVDRFEEVIVDKSGDKYFLYQTTMSDGNNLWKIDPLSGKRQLIYQFANTIHAGDLENIRPLNDNYWLLKYYDQLALVKVK